MNDTFTLSILKAALAAGHIALINAETASEEQQLTDLRTAIHRSRSQSNALLFSLLADEVYLDGVNIGWHIFEDLNNEDDSTSRIAIKSATPEFQSFVKLTDSGPNYWRSGLVHADSKEVANRLAGLEPLIWRSVSRRTKRSDRLMTRDELRHALDTLVRRPELIDMEREMVDGQQFDAFAREAFRQIRGQNAPTIELANGIGALCRVTITKGFVASNAVHEATIRRAIYPVNGLTFGRNRRRADISKPFGTHDSDEVIAAARLFLEEIEYWPIAQDFLDVLRIRCDRHFVTFRDSIRNWVSALLNGDTSEEQRLRREIAKANKSMRRATTCSRIGGIFTYLGRPLIILDALTIPAFGTPVTVAGFGLQAYADWLKSKTRWLIVGK